MGLYKKYDDTALVTQINDLTDLTLSNQTYNVDRMDAITLVNDGQAQTITDLLLADINQKA